ncbi:MAG: hypothetical protein HQ515_26875, partial [Phycisphaeraceae bacterium]|nr:hypothetical protein [Phycisphaeraceae bacterium]
MTILSGCQSRGPKALQPGRQDAEQALYAKPDTDAKGPETPSDIHVDESVTVVPAIPAGTTRPAHTTETLLPEPVQSGLINQAAQTPFRGDGAALVMQSVMPPYDSHAMESEWSMPAAEPVVTWNTSTDFNAPDANEVLDLSLPESMRLTQLLELVGQYLGFDMVYEPHTIPEDAIILKLQGQLQGKMRVQDLYALLQTALKFKKLAMVRQDEHLIAVVPIEDVMEADPAMIAPNKTTVQTGDLVVTRLFTLQHVSAASAKTFLESMKLGLAISIVEQTQTLFVTCYTHRLDRVEQLIHMIDQPGETRFFKIRLLRYTSAESLAPRIRALAGQLQDIPVVLSGLSGSSPSLGPVNSGPKTNTHPSVRSKTPAYLDTDTRTNRIITIGSQRQLDLIDKLITSLDVPLHDQRHMRSYCLIHMQASQAMHIISQLLETNTPDSDRITGRGPVSSDPVSQNEVGASSLNTLKISVLEATNALLVYATPLQHQRLSTILTHIDVPTQDTINPYEIYALENHPPEHLAGVLKQIVQETGIDPQAKIEQSLPKPEDKIVIVPDDATSCLIVYASRANQDWIKTLIKALDRRRPQVLIDVTLVEIRETHEFSYDLKLISGLPDLTQTSGQIGAFTTGSQTVTEKLKSLNRSSFTEFRTHSGAGFYADSHINVLLSAVESKHYGRILAKPKILVNDNETGIIKTTEMTYVSKTSSVPVSSGGAGNTATLVETALEYEAYDAGITLEITPHTSADDLLRLDISLNRSDFGVITGESPPDESSSDLTTHVTVPNAST